MSEQTLRIIDANLNRASEGLRLLEDVARLGLNDAGLSEQLKTIRHEVVRGDLSFNESLIRARDSEGDVGMALEVPGEDREKDIPLMVVANARRVQESLRVLEEFAKIPGMAPQLDSDKYKNARFKLYTIEQELLSKLNRLDKKRHISGLYAIIDTQFLKGRSHEEAALQVMRGGASIVQLRDKSLGKRDLLAIAHKLKILCHEHEVLFIVNDYLDIALASDADGVHVGQQDLPVSAARKLLPMGKLLGCSARTIELAVKAETDGADYVSVGAMYPTASKDDTAVVGLERLREIRQAVTVPLVAIGGINKNNAAEVISAGADAVAVISAILDSDNIEMAARQIVAQLRGKNDASKR